MIDDNLLSTVNSTAIASASDLEQLRPERPSGFAVLALILVSSAVIRVLLWFWFAGLSPHIGDEKDYDVLAKNLVEFGEYCYKPGTPATLRPPLYPLMVAGIYELFGVEDYQAVRLVQILLSLGNVVIVYLLAAELVNRRAALWAASIFAFYPSFLGYSNLLLTETLFTFFLCAFCLSLTRLYTQNHLSYALAAGLLLALAALTRSIVWMAPPFLILFLLATWQVAWPRRLSACLGFLIAFVVVLTPWSIRSSLAEGNLVVVDTMGGRNFMMGNYEHTPLYRSWDAIGIQGEKSWIHQVVENYPVEVRDTQGKIDKLAMREGVKFIEEHPGLTLARDIVKFFDFWGLERELISGAGEGFFGAVPKPAWLALSVLVLCSYAATLFLGIYGAILFPLQDRRLHWLIIFVIAYVCGIHSIVFAHSRYHLPIMPFVMIFAANAIVHLREFWLARATWRFALASGLVGVVVLGWGFNILAGDWQRFIQLTL